VTDSEYINRITAWVEGYQRAWNSNDPAEIGALFTDDARYYQRPYWEPWTGREQIVAEWLAHKDEPDDYTFSWHPILVGPDVGVVQGETIYRQPPQTYSNMWVIRLDDSGRCSEFTEWWMDHAQPAT